MFELTRQRLENRRLQRDFARLLESRGRKLHMGCGDDYIEGRINVDSDPESKADLVMNVWMLRQLPDACVEAIESYHFFEHMHYFQAVWLLEQWFRLLAPGGGLVIELPDFEVCVRELGRHFDDAGHDMALGGIYGHPPDIKRRGIAHVHKWGWTFESLSAELGKAGFTGIGRHPVRQAYRPSTAFGRDMQLRARRPAAGEARPS